MAPQTYTPNNLPADIFVYRQSYDTVTDNYTRTLLSATFAALFAYLFQLFEFPYLSLLCVSVLICTLYQYAPGKGTIYVEVRAKTSIECLESDSRPLPDRSSQPVLGALYRLEYYVLVNNAIMPNNMVSDFYPDVYEDLFGKGLLDECLQHRDLISSALYNELITRKTVSASLPALSTLASRCDYIDQAPRFLMMEGSSISRCTVKLASLQLTSCSVPLFQAKVTSVSFSTGTESTTPTSSQNTRPSRTRSRFNRSRLGIRNVLQSRWLYRFVFLVIAFIGLILIVESILFLAVPNDTRSDPRPASGGSDATFGDSLSSFSESSGDELCSPLSTLPPHPVTRSGSNQPGTRKTGKINLTPLTMDSVTSRSKRAIQLLNRLMKWRRTDSDWPGVGSPSDD